MSLRVRGRTEVYTGHTHHSHQFFPVPNLQRRCAPYCLCLPTAVTSPPPPLGVSAHKDALLHGSQHARVGNTWYVCRPPSDFRVHEQCLHAGHSYKKLLEFSCYERGDSPPTDARPGGWCGSEVLLTRNVHVDCIRYPLLSFAVLPIIKHPRLLLCV